jgi:hypothetical protein
MHSPFSIGAVRHVHASWAASLARPSGKVEGPEFTAAVRTPARPRFWMPPPEFDRNRARYLQIDARGSLRIKISASTPGAAVWRGAEEWRVAPRATAFARGPGD